MKRKSYPRTFKITTKMIAGATGKTVGAVRSDIRKGLCNPYGLFDFACYLLSAHSAVPKKRRKSRSDKGVARPKKDDVTLDYDTTQERVNLLRNPLSEPPAPDVPF